MKKTAEELDGSEPAAEALPLLVEAHGGRLHSFGLRFCANSEEAQDMVQETFLQAFRGWDGFDGRAKASTWLYTIASRVCHRFHRKRVGEPTQLFSLEELLPFGEPAIAVVPEAEDPLAGPIREEARQRIEQAVAELPDEFRMPFVLKEIAGLALAEVAAVLEIKEATAKTRVHRARLLVRKALERALPRREVPPPIFSRQVCLDLLNAKQDCLDRGAPFTFPDQVICERCAEVFSTMDLTREVCEEISHGSLPPELRRAVIDALERERAPD